MASPLRNSTSTLQAREDPPPTPSFLATQRTALPPAKPCACSTQSKPFFSNLLQWISRGHDGERRAVASSTIYLHFYAGSSYSILLNWTQLHYTRKLEVSLDKKRAFQALRLKNPLGEWVCTPVPHRHPSLQRRVHGSRCCAKRPIRVVATNPFLSYPHASFDAEQRSVAEPCMGMMPCRCRLLFKCTHTRQHRASAGSSSRSSCKPAIER